MPGPELAQYGIATFAVAGLIFIVNKFFDRKNNKDNTIYSNTIRTSFISTCL